MGFQTMRRAAVAGLTLITIGSFTNTARAQAIIRGFLYDDATGKPILGTVMLVDPSNDAAVVHTSTDSAGQFSLSIDHGRVQLAAVKPGYKSVLSAPIDLVSGEKLTLRIPIAEQGDPTHRIGVLEHVKPERKVEQSAVNPGYESRRASGMGIRYDRTQIEKSPYHSLGQFLQNVPGFRVVDPNSTNSMMMTRNQSMNIAGSIGGPAVSCRVGWFIDGHRMDIPGRSDPVTDGLGSISLENIEAVEVFRGLSEMPAEFAAPDLRCGAIAVWMRKG